MNNFEKVNNLPEESPDQRRVKLFGQIVPKVTRAIMEAESLDDKTQYKIDRIINKTSDKNNITFDRDTLVCESLELITERDGGLSDKLQEAYEILLAGRIADTVQKQGRDSLYEVLKEQLMTLKSKNIYVDDEGIERMVIDLLRPQDGDSEVGDEEV